MDQIEWNIDIEIDIAIRIWYKNDIKWNDVSNALMYWYIKRSNIKIDVWSFDVSDPKLMTQMGSELIRIDPGFGTMFLQTSKTLSAGYDLQPGLGDSVEPAPSPCKGWGNGRVASLGTRLSQRNAIQTNNDTGIIAIPIVD